MFSKRLGVIIPSVNVVMEDDLRRFMPSSVGSHIARLRLRRSTPGVSQQALANAAEEAPGIAAELADARVDAIALACAGASLMGGANTDQRVIERIQSEYGIPATTTIMAVTQAFRMLNLKRVVLCSPFEDWFNEAEATHLRSAGFEIVGLAGLGISDARECATVPPAEIQKLAIKETRDDADGVFLSCANMRGFEVAARLEKEIGKPVVTSNQAVIWALLNLAGVEQEVLEGGSLFQKTTRVAA